MSDDFFLSELGFARIKGFAGFGTVAILFLKGIF